MSKRFGEVDLLHKEHLHWQHLLTNVWKFCGPGNEHVHSTCDMTSQKAVHSQIPLLISGLL